jgi:hypothetical protein
MNCHKILPLNYCYSRIQQSFYDAEIQNYITVGWDTNNSKIYWKTEPVKWVRIHNLPDFVISITLST